MRTMVAAGVEIKQILSWVYKPGTTQIKTKTDEYDGLLLLQKSMVVMILNLEYIEA